MSEMTFGATLTDDDGKPAEYLWLETEMVKAGEGDPAQAGLYLDVSSGGKTKVAGWLTYEQGRKLAEELAARYGLLSYAVKPTQAAPRPAVKTKGTCPACGASSLATWYEGSRNDPGDVSPRAECKSLACDFTY